MLIQSIFSPARPESTKTASSPKHAPFPCIVLASLSRTVKGEPPASEHPSSETVHVSRIAEGVFEHAAAAFSSCSRRVGHRSFAMSKSLFRGREAAPSIAKFSPTRRGRALVLHAALTVILLMWLDESFRGRGPGAFENDPGPISGRPPAAAKIYVGFAGEVRCQNWGYRRDSDRSSPPLLQSGPR